MTEKSESHTMTKAQLRKLSLDELKERALSCHACADDALEAASRAIQSSLHHARNAGLALHLIKLRVKGMKERFGQWLKGNFPASPETARVYMMIAKKQNWELIVIELANNPKLSIDGARKLIRKPKSGKVKARSGQTVRQLGAAVARFLSNWNHEELLFLAHYELFLGKSCGDLLMDHLDGIRAEIRPLAEPVIAAEERRLAAMNKLLINQDGGYDDERDRINGAYVAEIRNAFKNRKDLTAYQRAFIESQIKEYAQPQEAREAA